MMEVGTEGFSYTKNWVPIGNSYYRMIEINEMLWSGDQNLSHSLLVAYPNAGSITLFQKHVSKIARVPVYSSYGHLMSTIIYDNGQLIAVGWTSNETLLLINSSGLISDFDIFGTKLEDYRLSDDRIQAAHVFFEGTETFVVAISASKQLLVKRGLNNPFDDVTSISNLNSAITCWTAYFCCDDQNYRAIICAFDQQILSVSTGTVEYILLHSTFDWNHISRMAISPDNNNIALLSDTSNIWCGTIDFQTCLYEINCDTFSIISRLSWCGSKAIIYVSGNDYVLQAGEFDSYAYCSDTPVVIIPEADGARVVTKRAHMFIQEIPKCLENVYMVWNDHGSTLLDSYNHYKEKSYKTIELIEKLGSNIESAICRLIEASAHEWQIAFQRILLKAAMYGRSFFQISNKNLFYQTCKNLRILNNLRNVNVGMPLTYHQMTLLGPDEILKRLVRRKSFTLAYEVADSLQQTEGINYVLTSWAQNTILTAKKSEMEIADEIIKILSVNTSVPITSIVNAAINLKKIDLAIKLVEFNSTPEMVVATLLQVGNINRAVRVAVDSFDPWIVYSVILYMKNTLTENDFLLRLSTNSCLNALGVQYLKLFEPPLLMLLYKQDAKSKNMTVHQLLSTVNQLMPKKMEVLRQIMELNKQKGIIRTTCNNALTLAEQQATLDRQNNQTNTYSGLSPLSTVFKLCESGQIQEALKIKSEISIPDARFCWCAVSALAKSGHWSKVDQIYDMKKSALSVSSYCDIYITYKAPASEMEKYLSKLGPNDRCSYYLKTDQITKAAELAIKSADSQIINKVLASCKIDTHDSLIAQLQNYL